MVSTKPGQLVSFTEGRFSLFRTTFILPDSPIGTDYSLTLKNVIGKAEVWLNNQLLATKKTAISSDMQVVFKGIKKPYKLVVLLEAERNQKAGLGGIVNIEKVTE